MQVCGECGQRYERGGYCPADGTPLTLTDDPLLGTEVGRYRLARLLGGGGMGRVYMAVQPMIGSRVAIKLLDETCARNPELLERFFAEARAVNLIRHENIVSVIDLAQLPDGRPYIVMEFIDGMTLGDLVRSSVPASGPLPLGGVIQVMSEVLSALHAAHAIGIVHRDLKPDNIVVTGEGHAKVLDFGIAKLAPSLGHAISPRTRTGALLGTPAYMAPEQITGSGNIDPRTDLYAAGVVLFEATTGRTPFQTETLFDLMKAHLEQQPPPPRTLRPDLPVELEQVILCALAKRPEHRFASAAAMATALDAAAARLPIEQRRALSSRGGLLAGRGVSTGGGRQLDVPPAMQQTVPATPVAKRRGKRNWIAALVLAIAAIATVVVLVVLGDDTTEVARAPDPPPKREAPPPRQEPAPVKPVEVTEPPAKPVEPATPVAETPKIVEPAKKKSREPAAPAAPLVKTAQLGPGEHEVPPPAGVHVEGNVHFIVKDPVAHLARPADYNPKRFDPIAYLPKAEALARQLLDDAQLTSFEFDPVYPDGHVELSGRDHEYDFRSPSKSGRPAGTPKNVKLDQACRVHVEVTPTQIVAELRTSETCTERIVRKPRCTFAQLWARAKADHKVDNDMVVRIGWLYDEKWFFDTDPDTIGHGGGVNSFEDKCP